MSLAVGLTIPETADGTIVANLAYDNVEHPEPVFHGDTIRAETTVTETRLASDEQRGVVTMRVDVYNDESALVCTSERTVLVERANE